MKKAVLLIAVSVFIFNAKINAQQPDLSSNPRVNVDISDINEKNTTRVVNVKYPIEVAGQTSSNNGDHRAVATVPADFLFQIFGKAVIGPLSQPTGKDNNYRLSVDGKIVSKEVVVRIDNWADYVFTNNYRLMPLKDVKKYLEINQHLPGINAASEVEEMGLNLGEMQKKHMEKTEELYLYVIQLSEQMEQLKTENEALKKEMQQLKK